MAAKTGFRSQHWFLCTSGGNQVVKSSIDVKRQKQMVPKNKSFTSDASVKLNVELRRQILKLRDVLDFPPVDGAASTPELLTTTVEDLYKTYPEIIAKLPISDIRGASTKQGLAYFWSALISIGDSWTKNEEWRVNIKSALQEEHEKISSEKLVGDVLWTLDYIIKLAKVKFELMDAEDNDWNRSKAVDIVLKKRPNGTFSGENSGGSSPISPTSVLPELPETLYSDHFGDFAKQSYTVNHTVPFKHQPVGKLDPTKVEPLPFHSPLSLEDKYQFRWLKNKEAEQPPPEKKVKLELNAAEGEMLDVDGDNSTRPALRTPNQLLGKIISQPVLSAKALALPAQPLRSPSKNLTQILAPPPPPLELQSNESTLPMRPAQEFTNPSSLQPLLLISPHQSSNLLVPLPNTEVLAGLKGMAPVPPLPPPAPTSISGNLEGTPPPPPSRIPSILKGPPPPPPPSNLKGLPPHLPPSSLKEPPPPPPPSTLRGPPPPPPMIPSKGAPPLPPMPGAAPPPPPSLRGITLGLKVATRLKRSSQMGNLYRLLKGKVEGSSLNVKSTQGRKSNAGSGTSGKQGMADALAEITKRSAYFQQIEADALKYAKTITELKSTITGFQTKDMIELVKFHKQVESQLENLTDESQVLSRFEGFPTKKLECLRMAAALYMKLESIHTTIVNWKIVPPMSQLLVKVDMYFTKMKGEVDGIERTKDEELKKFKSHNIHFDFSILVKIKESMVDLSSGCMELALKESREAKSLLNNTPKKGSEGPAKMLWKAFQFAFRVYTFAGGQDDRAERLTKELAQEIETEPDL
ncbi:hypothetical protein QQ045_012012 [Rhodiola kirilowii]